jgi:hypothetical protein
VIYIAAPDHEQSSDSAARLRNNNLMQNRSKNDVFSLFVLNIKFDPHEIPLTRVLDPRIRQVKAGTGTYTGTKCIAEHI